MIASYKNIIALLLVFFVLTIGASAAFAQSAFDDPETAQSVAAQASGGGATGGLVPSEDTFTTGEITIGSSAQAVVLFTNGTSQTVEFKDINLYPSSNVTATVANNACSQEALTPGAECAIILSIKGVSTGALRVTVLARHDGIKKLVTATVEGMVISSGEEGDEAPILTDLEIIPSAIDFGTLEQSRPIIRSATIKNISTEALTISNIDIDAAQQSGFTFKHNCDTLDQGEACIVSVVWAPVLDGPASGSMVISHSGPAKTANVPLSGEYDSIEAQGATVFPSALPGRGLLISDITEFNFGETVSSPSALTATLVNAGDTSLTLKDINISGEENGLSLGSGGCLRGLALKPTEACALTLKWSPIREGEVIDSIQINHDGARGVFVIPVLGTATEAVTYSNRTLVSGDGSSIRTSASDDGTDTSEIDNEIEGLSNVQLPDSVRSFMFDDLPTRGQAPSLENFVITSHSPTKAIISGPGGTRVVRDGTPMILNGTRWQVNVVAEGVEFLYGKQKVLLIFDNSLSPLTRTSDEGSSAGPSEDEAQ